MGENVGTIYYTVEAETAALLNAEKAVSKSMGNMAGEMTKADKAADQLNATMTGLSRAIKAVIAASALREMAGMVQKYQEMAERVQMATSSQAEFEMVQRRLLATANGTYRSLEEAQELYIRTADSLRSMGYSTEQALDVTDSMSYAFVKNATSADRAEAAISQFSKSMNTGKVSADQWETISSAIPSVIDDIAKATGKTGAAIRKLGAEGKLTAAQLSEGLRKSLDENAKAAAGMANNLTDAGVRARTAITAVLVAMEERSGALQAFTDGIIAAADAVLSLAGDGEAMTAIMDGLTTAGLALSAVIAGRLIGAFFGFAGAQMRAASAMGAATVAANGLRTAMALLGGPAGLILLGATAVFTLGKNSADAASKIRSLNTEVKDLTKSQVELEKILLPQQIEEARKKYESTAAAIEKMENAKNVKHADAMNVAIARRKVLLEAQEKAYRDLVERQKQLSSWKPAAAPKPNSNTPDPDATPPDVDAIKKQIEALEKRAETLGMSSDELIIDNLLQAKATDGQIRHAQAILSTIAAYEQQVQAEEELQKRREQINAAGGGDAYIAGDTKPLSGGMFDQHAARYEAERKAEEQRYQEQLKRLADVQAAEQQHTLTKEQLYQQHIDRMNQIDQARADLLIQTTGDAFGQMSSDLMAFATVYGAENRKMFEMAKAAAIASTLAETYVGAQRAFSAMAGIPVVGPSLGVAAAGAAVLGGMARVAQIRSQSMPGRQYGGPVAAGGMYRINETGAPEVFNAANGRQYMLPNQRGEVVSNANASRPPMANIQVINNGPPVNVRQEVSGDQIKLILDMAEDRMAGSFTSDGKVGKAAQRAFGLRRAGR